MHNYGTWFHGFRDSFAMRRHLSRVGEAKRPSGRSNESHAAPYRQIKNWYHSRRSVFRAFFGISTLNCRAPIENNGLKFRKKFSNNVYVVRTPMILTRPTDSAPVENWLKLRKIAISYRTHRFARLGYLLYESMKFGTKNSYVKKKIYPYGSGRK